PRPTAPQAEAPRVSGQNDLQTFPSLDGLFGDPLDAWTKPKPHSPGSFWDASSTDAHLRFSPGDAGSPIGSAGGVSPLSQGSTSSAPLSSAVDPSPLNGLSLALSGAPGISSPTPSNIPGITGKHSPQGFGPLAPARMLDITD